MDFVWDIDNERWNCLALDALVAAPEDEDDFDAYDELSKFGDEGMVYGNLYAGRLNAEIHHSYAETGEPWGILADVYAYGIDDGYSQLGDITYSLTRITFDVPIEAPSLEEFKLMCVERFAAAIRASTPEDTAPNNPQNGEDPVELAEAPLANWNSEEEPDEEKPIRIEMTIPEILREMYEEDPEGTTELIKKIERMEKEREEKYGERNRLWEEFRTNTNAIREMERKLKELKIEHRKICRKINVEPEW